LAEICDQCIDLIFAEAPVVGGDDAGFAGDFYNKGPRRWLLLRGFARAALLGRPWRQGRMVAWWRAGLIYFPS
jgi:hypothetical protein